jgi:hypothetical protein
VLHSDHTLTKPSLEAVTIKRSAAVSSSDSVLENDQRLNGGLCYVQTTYCFFGKKLITTLVFDKHAIFRRKLEKSQKLRS